MALIKNRKDLEENIWYIFGKNIFQEKNLKVNNKCS